jgi:hypothetical protein
MADAEDEEKRALLHFLHYQRDSVLSIVAGLDQEAWHRSVVPSGWTPAGLVEHLGDAPPQYQQGPPQYQQAPPPRLQRRPRRYTTS